MIGEPTGTSAEGGIWLRVMQVIKLPDRRSLRGPTPGYLYIVRRFRRAKRLGAGVVRAPGPVDNECPAAIPATWKCRHMPAEFDRTRHRDHVAPLWQSSVASTTDRGGWGLLLVPASVCILVMIAAAAGLFPGG